MKKLYICPVCGRAFLDEEDLRVTCSNSYHTEFMLLDKKERARLTAEAEKKRRPARTDCRCHDPERRDCLGLTALWCTVEDCKFYKSKEGKR